MPNEVINESFVSHLGNQSNPPCGEFSSIGIALKDYYKSNLYFGIFAVLLPLNVLNSSLKMYGFVFELYIEKVFSMLKMCKGGSITRNITRKWLHVF